MKKILILTILLLPILSCKDNSVNKIRIKSKIEHPVLYLPQPDITKLSPIEFLNELKYKENTPKDYFGYHNDSIPNNWVKKEHLPKLIEQLDNNQLAHPVVSVYASITIESHGLSTIGNEAYYLLLSYRTNNYPPYSTFNLGNNENDTTTLSLEKKNEMLNWWRASDLSKHDFK